MSYAMVAVGILFNKEGKVLIAKRQPHQHLADCWEFPGGKVEQGESLDEALKREFQEELGILVQASSPWLEVQHDYGDKKVCLNVHKITSFSGEPRGCEGQEICWVDFNTLMYYPFPSANQPIIEALQSLNK